MSYLALSSFQVAKSCTESYILSHPVFFFDKPPSLNSALLFRKSNLPSFLQGFWGRCAASPLFQLWTTTMENVCSLSLSSLFIIHSIRFSIMWDRKEFTSSHANGIHLVSASQIQELTEKKRRTFCKGSI